MCYACPITLGAVAICIQSTLFVVVSVDTVCCPLEGSSDCDRPSFYDVTTRRAAKEHVCSECKEVIHRGTKHQHITMMYDGSISRIRMCLLCVEIGDHFSCGEGRILEQLWSDLEENFFPDMAAGGKCMEGLSPAAKQKLIDARMKWYFGQDEIDDSGWKSWAAKRPGP